jgi:RNA polymerase sigma-70 factor (ECF subfamily)
MDEREAEERAWLTGLRRGDARAFDALYAAYRTPIYSFLLRLCARRDVADDLFQETWLRAARAARRLREDTRLRAWLFTIARRVHVSYRRWSVLDVSRFVRAERDLEPAALDPALQPDEHAGARELERALDRLPPRDREVLLLVAVQGLDQQEAACVLDISHASLRQRLTRARARLASALGRAEQHDTGTNTIEPQPTSRRETT